MYLFCVTPTTSVCTSTAISLEDNDQLWSALCSAILIWLFSALYLSPRTACINYK